MPRKDPQSINYILPKEAIDAIQKLPRKYKGIEIPAQILADRRLSPIEKILFGFLLATDLTDNGSYWTNKTITELIDISHPLITNAFSKFTKLGLASVIYTKTPTGIKRTVRSLYKLGLVYDPSHEIFKTPLKDSLRPPLKNLYDNIDSKESIDNIKLKPNTARERALSRKKDKIKLTDKIYTQTSLEYQLAEELYKLILIWRPDKNKPNLNKWAYSFDIMLNIKQWSFPVITSVLKYWQSDSYWRSSGGPSFLLTMNKKQEQTMFEMFQDKIINKTGRTESKTGYRTADPHKYDHLVKTHHI